MPLDPQIYHLLELEREAQVPRAYEQTVAAARAAMEQRQRQPGPSMASEEDRVIPGPNSDIPIRVYRPREATGAGLVYFHGGGWVLGNLDTHNFQCRSLAQRAGCMVVAVHYRRAPEHRFPAAALDAYAAAEWVCTNAGALDVDPARIGVTGESAGGNLAAVTCLMARDRGGPPLKLQLLLYPVIDHSFRTQSYQQNGAYGLDLPSMVWFWTHYLGPDQDGFDPHASPLQAQSLTGLPRAIVVTSEFDVLRDEGAAYANRLREAGITVEYRCVPGVNHAFLGMPVDAAGKAFDEIGALLRDRKS